MYKKQQGNITVVVLLAILLVVGGFAGWRVYKADEKPKTETTKTESTANSSSEEAKETAPKEGELRIAGTSLAVDYPKNWTVSDTDELYDYVLTSDTDFKLVIDVLEKDEEAARGCGDCIHESFGDSITLDGKAYPLVVPGGFSGDKELSRVTLSQFDNKLVLPILTEPGKEFYYSLDYFPGAPDSISANDQSFKDALAIMKSLHKVE